MRLSSPISGWKEAIKCLPSDSKTAESPYSANDSTPCPIRLTFGARIKVALNGLSLSKFKLTSASNECTCLPQEFRSTSISITDSDLFNLSELRHDEIIIPAQVPIIDFLLANSISESKKLFFIICFINVVDSPPGMIKASQ